MIFIIALVVVIIVISYWGSRNTPKKSTRHPSRPQNAKKQLTKQTIHPPIPISTSTPISEPNPKAVPQALQNFHLISTAECDQMTLANILKITQTVPRPHPMLNALTQGIDNSEQLYQLIQSDVEVAAKILQTVNSSGFYLEQTITRLNHAIIYLGTNMVKDIALQCVIHNGAAPKNKKLESAFKKIWANGFLASSLAFLLAQQLGLSNASELATQALLSYIGDLAIISYTTKRTASLMRSASLFERITLEQQHLGTNSAIVGGQLAQVWSLPQELVNGISDNLIPLAIAPSSCPLQGPYLTNVVFCYLCCRLAEIIINQDVHDLADIDLLNSELLELAYLPEYLHLAGLGQFFVLQQAPACRNKVRKLILQQ